MKNTFTPIWTDILDSSVWDEPYHVRILWIAMLALQEADYVVRYDTYKLAKRAGLKQEEVMDGLMVLSSPDTRKLEPQPEQGRRILKVANGWFIVNGQKYRQRMQEIKNRMSKARSAARKREREASGNDREKNKKAAPVIAPDPSVVLPAPSMSHYCKVAAEDGIPAADSLMDGKTGV